MDKTAAQIAGEVGGTVVGDGDVRVTGVNGIKDAGPGDLTFLRAALYRPFLATTRAAAVLVRLDVKESRATLIQVEDPDLALVQVLDGLLAERVCHPVGIHGTAVIGRDVVLGEDVALDAHVVLADGCEIGDRVVVYAGSYVGRGAVIGSDTVVWPNVTVREGVRVGARCLLHSGVVLGADGFGFAPAGGVWRKIPQVGTVAVGDDVEIGANSAVDRATFGVTRVGNGTKIDNLVQIGHNVEIGECCVLSGKVGIAGSATVGNHVVMGAGSGVGGHIEIGDGVQIGGLSGVNKSVKPGRVVSGFPAMDHTKDMRIQASQRMLPAALRRLRALEARFLDLEEQLHGQAADDS